MEANPLRGGKVKPDSDNWGRPHEIKRENGWIGNPRGQRGPCGAAERRLETEAWSQKSRSLLWGVIKKVSHLW